MGHETTREAKYESNYIGNVIRIIDNRTVIVNAGKGTLSVGDKIQIYEPGEMLKDIDGTDLCYFDFIKDELDVIRVEMQYSLCRKMKSQTRTYSFPLSPLLEHTETKYIPLNVNEDDIQDLKPTEPMVKIGDPIKLA